MDVKETEIPSYNEALGMLAARAREGSVTAIVALERLCGTCVRRSPRTRSMTQFSESWPRRRVPRAPRPSRLRPRG